MKVKRYEKRKKEGRKNGKKKGTHPGLGFKGMTAVYICGCVRIIK